MTSAAGTAFPVEGRPAASARLHPYRRILACVLLATSTFASACSVPPDRTPALNPDPALLYAPHGRPGAWFNPWRAWNKHPTDLLRWMVSRSSYAGEWRDPPQVGFVANDGTSFAAPERRAAITWIGHSTFAVHDRADVFLTDPHFGPRALIPRRYHPPGVPIAAIPADAFAVVSHNHYDHLDAYTVETLPRTVTWYVPSGLGAWFVEKGRRAVELDWWQTAEHGRWQVTCVPTQHWSRRIGQAENATLWCGWVVRNAERTYYFAGDTGYFHGFTEIGEKFGPIDVAMLPIGAYLPRWIMRYSHLNPAEAYRAFLDLEATWMLPCHWSTFRLTDEPIDEAPHTLRRAVEHANGSWDPIRVLAVGERWEVPE